MGFRSGLKKAFGKSTPASDPVPGYKKSAHFGHVEAERIYTRQAVAEVKDKQAVLKSLPTHARNAHQKSIDELAAVECALKPKKSVRHSLRVEQKSCGGTLTSFGSIRPPPSGRPVQFLKPDFTESPPRKTIPNKRQVQIDMVPVEHCLESWCAVEEALPPPPKPQSLRYKPAGYVRPQDRGKVPAVEKTALPKAPSLRYKPEGYVRPQDRGKVNQPPKLAVHPNNLPGAVKPKISLRVKRPSPIARRDPPPAGIGFYRT